jgi:molecular chaperone GrpE (heat shock protein)
MAEEKKEEKKIIIDEDWKIKAQKEKEVQKTKEEIGKKEEESEQQEQQYPLPKGDFSSLISLLATQAMFAMGVISTEKDKESKKDLRLAKFHIDILESLEEKTKGNLTGQEQKFLSDTLSRLRMGFVNMAG